jgi:twitching motility two-component system response regulator PilH
MSEAMTVPPLTDGQTKRTPTVYFIDDSATMREVIKIAFRRECINVITCANAASALAQFEQNPPDAVITDVIMPDTDGYSVCTQVKQHPQFGGIPVILMSGVVNKTVADRAVSVQADELIRKPFQPQELIGRVKSLLAPKSATPIPTDRPTSHGAPTSLSSLFTPPTLAQSMSPNSLLPAPPEQRPSDSAWPRALADAFIPKPAFPPPSVPAAPSFSPNPSPTNAGHPGQPVSPSQSFPGGLPVTPPAAANPGARPPVTADVLRLRAEIARLDLLVKKLQTELQIERQYNQALESQLQNLTRCE